MYRYLFILAISMWFVSCADSKKDDKKSAETYHTDVLLKTTPVKQQGSSNLCWIYAMLATIETEHIMAGDSLELSPAYSARMFFKEQALQRYADEQHDMHTLRGMAPMTLRLLNRYGAMPYHSYKAPADVDYHVVLRKLRIQADSHRLRRTGLKQLDQESDQLLDDEIASVPLWVFMLGCQYTPLEFAHSVAGKDEYVALTSFTHHPFGSRFPLEVPDNRYQDEFLNMPLDSLISFITQSLIDGHPVCWEGDISEELFNFSEGIALMRDEHHQVGQEERQKAFDTFETTDDHCMEMVGLAHDTKGRRYFICKNSWGTDNRYQGFMLLSENYVRAKTICVILPSTALPEMSKIMPKEKNPISDDLFSENFM